MEEKGIFQEAAEFAEGLANGNIQLTDEERRRERRVKWKTDLIILPLLATVYFLASMGRSDLGNAKIAGMDKELKLTPQQYSNAASIFLVGYLIFQLPGTLLVRKMGPPYQFGMAMMAWGMVTACTVVVHSYGSLMVVRTFVGVAEAFVQGSVFYLSFWYPNNELATRGAVYFSTAALAGAFNGLIAYAVQEDLSNVNNWRPWRWIFLIEGVVPIGWALVVLAFLPSTPETVKFFFTEDEKDLLIKRSRRATNTGESNIKPKLILKLLVDPKFWMLVGIESATIFCITSLSNFLPDILHNFGWSSVKSQLMSVIVYACGFMSILFWARVSDKRGQRGLVILINLATATLGYILLITLTGDSGRFAGACIVAIGVYPNVVVNLTWAAGINVGYTFRASATALINSVAQAVAISSNQAYVDPPLYRKGHGAALGMVCFAGVCATALLFTLKDENRKKKLEQGSEKAQEMRRCTIDEIGNKHLDVFYSY